MFSRRVTYPLHKNRLTLLVEEMRSAGRAIFDLTESNPTHVGFSYPGGQILDALADPRSLLYQPNPHGLEETRRAVATYYQSRGKPVRPEDILLTASTSEAYAYLFKLLADPGEAVLTPQPSYPLFDFLAAAECLETVPYRLIYQHGWHVDVPELQTRLTPHTRALLLVHPNNPTGSFIKASEWQALRAVCRSHHLPVICDEVFSDYRLNPGEPAFDPWAEPEVLVFVLNGLSKTLGLPQMKLGWIVLSGADGQRKEAMTRLEIIADTFLSVGTPVQHATPRWLQLCAEIQPQIRSRLRANLDYACESLAGSAAECLPVEGGWYLVLRLPRVLPEEEWTLRLLRTYDTLVHPGYFYDFQEEPYLVVSLVPRPEVFRRGIGAVSEILRDT